MSVKEKLGGSFMKPELITSPRRGRVTHEKKNILRRIARPTRSQAESSCALLKEMTREKNTW